MRHYTKLIAIGVVAAIMASCSSVRKTEKAPEIGGLIGKAYVEKVISLAPEWQVMSSKVAFRLNMGGKNVKANASLKLKRGQLIRFSVAPLLGIEVARMDITPNGFLVIDRLNKRYVQLSFEELNKKWHLDFGFEALQALLLNEMFYPGKLDRSEINAGLFMIEAQSGQSVWLQAKTSRRLTYRFRTSVADGALQESSIGAVGSAYEMNWNYAGFGTLNGKSFPREMNVAIKGFSTPVNVDMDFSRLSVNENWDAVSEVSSRYTRVDFEDLLKMILK